MIGPSIDRSFMKDLKSLDSRLSVKFNGEHFVVCYDRGYGQPVNIYRVRGDNGGFRQPDQRDLAIIKGGDLSCGDSMRNRIQKLAYASETLRREAKRKAAEEIRAMTLDNKLQLKRFIIDKFNSGKGNAEFRRIPHKPGKNVVRTIP